MKTDYQLLHKELQEKGLFVNPLLSYSGSYFFQNLDFGFRFYDAQKDILWLNSNTQNGKNMYEEYVNKYFYGAMDSNLPHSIRQSFYPLVESDLDKEGKGRYLRFCYVPSLWNLFEDMNLLTDAPTDEVELAKYVKKILIQKRNQMNDVLKNGNKSAFYESVKHRFDSQGILMTPALLERQCEVFTKLIFIVKGMDESFFSRKIRPESFLSCFDYDKFCLLSSKCIFDYTLKTIKLENDYHKSLVEVFNYVQTVHDMNLSSYNPMIHYYDENTKRLETYCFKDLERDLAKFTAKYPKFQFFEVPVSEIEELGLKRDVNQLENYTNALLESRKADISCGWEIIRKGQRETQSKVTNNSPTFKTKKEKDYYLNFMKRRLFFESSRYACKVIGIHNFSGYQGYIYPNGIVVFEKLYEDAEQGKISITSNATYVMHIDNFSEFSKLTKPEIIEFIKNTSNPQIERKYHNETWEARMQAIIQGKSYTKEVEEKIDTLVSLQNKTNVK